MPKSKLSMRKQAKKQTRIRIKSKRQFSSFKIAVLAGITICGAVAFFFRENRRLSTASIPAYYTICNGKEKVCPDGYSCSSQDEKDGFCQPWQEVAMGDDADRQVLGITNSTTELAQGLPKLPSSVQKSSPSPTSINFPTQTPKISTPTAPSNTAATATPKPRQNPIQRDPKQNVGEITCSGMTGCPNGYKCPAAGNETATCVLNTQQRPMARMSTATETTEQTPISFSPNRKNINVISLAYIPIVNGSLDTTNTIQDPYGEFQMTLEQTKTKIRNNNTEMIQALQKGSAFHGNKNPSAKAYLQFTILDNKEFQEALPLSAKRNANNNLPIPNYLSIMNRINICDYVDNKKVREVWLWMYGGTGISGWESNFSSSYGDISNSDHDETDLPKCGHSYTVYSFNYGRGAEASVHSRIHQYENIFKYLDQDLFWNKYVGKTTATGYGIPQVPDERKRCGWAHYTPNSPSAYKYSVQDSIQSDCEDWNPDGYGTPSTFDCNKWGCTELGYFTWWMQNIPGENNGLTYQGKKLRNWWDFVADFDQAVGMEKSLATNSHLSDTSTPTPTLPPSTTNTVDNSLGCAISVENVPITGSPELWQVIGRAWKYRAQGMTGSKTTRTQLFSATRLNEKQADQKTWKQVGNTSLTNILETPWWPMATAGNSKYWLVCNSVLDDGKKAGGAQCSGNPNPANTDWQDCGDSSRLKIRSVEAPTCEIKSIKGTGLPGQLPTVYDPNNLPILTSGTEITVEAVGNQGPRNTRLGIYFGRKGTDGKWNFSGSTNQFPSINPAATKTVTWKVPKITEEIPLTHTSEWVVVCNNRFDNDNGYPPAGACSGNPSCTTNNCKIGKLSGGGSWNMPYSNCGDKSRAFFGILQADYY